MSPVKIRTKHPYSQVEILENPENSFSELERHNPTRLYTAASPSSLETTRLENSLLVSSFFSALPFCYRDMVDEHDDVVGNGSENRQLLDMEFRQGYIVVSASDPTGQMGVVEDVNILVDVLATNGCVVTDIPSKHLERIRDFIVGDYVILGSWLGRVLYVFDNVTVLLDDGSVCIITEVDPMQLQSICKILPQAGNFPYYPGQRVRASSFQHFNNVKWLCKMGEPLKEGTVIQVIAGSVLIHWIALAVNGPDCAPVPAEEQSPNDLKLLSYFSDTSWERGDWCFLPSPITSSDVLCTESSSQTKYDCSHEDLVRDDSLEVVPWEQLVRNHPSPQNTASVALDASHSLECPIENIEPNISMESRFSSSSLPVTKESGHENRPARHDNWQKVLEGREEKDYTFQRALLIVNTKTVVDVVWQDGRREQGLVSNTLLPITDPNDQEFVVEQYVMEKATEDDDINAGRRVGVVSSVDAKERTACVRWFKSVSRPEDPREFDKEEVVSVYELEGHPDFNFLYGDIVIRLSPVIPEKGDTANSESHGNFSDLSWVGVISDLNLGDIEVTWADGTISKVGPQAIYVVNDDDDDEPAGAERNISDDDVSNWETFNEDKTNSVGNAEEEARSQSTGCTMNRDETKSDSEESSSVQNGLLSVPEAASGFTTHLHAEPFLGGTKQIDPSIPEYNSGRESPFPGPGTIDAPERERSKIASSSQESTAVDGYPVQSFCESEEQYVLVPEATYNGHLPETVSSFMYGDPDADNGMRNYGNGPCTFKNFDTAKDPLDHFFRSANGQSNGGRNWIKKVEQDWSILQKNLPETIYVRVYEDRMDLLRAVIVGAYGTPYQDGLFVFDFHLPPDYPQVPPSVHYHSGGWRINPNLYEEGKVCLSLLNTWTGRGNEVWDPSSSSILQVLVSLQGLVLNAKPYFNEAGYDKQVGTAVGEKNSLAYNENTFLLTCKTIMYLLRRPPKDFEELIKEHFKRRSHYILEACDAYMKGYLIGTLEQDASLGAESTENATSRGFKLALTKILPKLIAALSDGGANVKHQSPAPTILVKEHKFSSNCFRSLEL